MKQHTKQILFLTLLLFLINDCGTMFHVEHKASFKIKAPHKKKQ